MSSLMSLFGSLMGNNNNNVDDNEALSREHQCANCGKGEEEDNVHLKKCNGCNGEVLCNAICQKEHRP